MISIVLMFVLSYFLGAMVPGFWIGKLFYHKDIRDEGSGNIGTTNSFRVLGPVAGIMTLVLDLLKGTAAGLLPLAFNSTINPMLVGLASVIRFLYGLNLKVGKP